MVNLSELYNSEKVPALLNFYFPIQESEKEQANYIAFGEILDDLQTLEGAGYATAAIATIYVAKRIKLGRVRTIEQVLDNPKLLESMHPADFKKM